VTKTRHNATTRSRDLLPVVLYRVSNAVPVTFISNQFQQGRQLTDVNLSTITVYDDCSTVQCVMQSFFNRSMITLCIPSRASVSAPGLQRPMPPLLANPNLFRNPNMVFESTFLRTATTKSLFPMAPGVQNRSTETKSLIDSSTLNHSISHTHTHAKCFLRMLTGTCRKLNTEKRLMIMNVDSEPKPNVDKTETWRTSAHQLRLIASDFLPVWTGFLHDRCPFCAQPCQSIG